MMLITSNTGGIPWQLHTYHPCPTTMVGVTNLIRDLVLEFENSSPYANESGVNGSYHTLQLVKPMVIVTMFVVFGSYAPFMMSLNLNLGLPHNHSLFKDYINLKVC